MEQRCQIQLAFGRSSNDRWHPGASTNHQSAVYVASEDSRLLTTYSIVCPRVQPLPRKEADLQVLREKLGHEPFHFSVCVGSYASGFFLGNKTKKTTKTKKANNDVMWRGHIVFRPLFQRSYFVVQIRAQDHDHLSHP